MYAKILNFLITSVLDRFETSLMVTEEMPFSEIIVAIALITSYSISFSVLLPKYLLLYILLYFLFKYINPTSLLFRTGWIEY